jgi:hypothetical protein
MLEEADVAAVSWRVRLAVLKGVAAAHLTTTKTHFAFHVDRSPWSRTMRLR